MHQYRLHVSIDIFLRPSFLCFCLQEEGNIPGQPGKQWDEE